MFWIRAETVLCCELRKWHVVWGSELRSFLFRQDSSDLITISDQIEFIP